MSTRPWRAFLLAGAFLCAAVGQTPAEHAGPLQKRVLLLHSYHQGYDWTDDVGRTISAELRKEFENPELHVEYMDVRRFGGPDGIALVKKMVRRKYRGTRLDLIISTDDAALAMLHEAGEELLGRVPVVFCGVSNRAMVAKLDRRRFTGLIEVFSFGKVLEMARKLRPSARRAVFVLDASENAKPFRAAYQDLAPRVGFESWEFLEAEELGLDGILERLKRAPADALVVAMAFNTDRGNVNVNEGHAMAAIAGASQAPVFSPNISLLGQGIVTGNANGGLWHGTAAAKLAVRVLRGERPETVAVAEDGAYGPVVDWAAMRRWGISEATLPPEAVVVNAPQQSSARFRPWLIGAGAFIVVEAAIIGLLIWNILGRRRAEAERAAQAAELEQRSRRQDELNRSLISEMAARESTEKALRDSEARYRDLVENARDGIYSHDLNGRFLSANKMMCDVLGYPREQLLCMGIEDVVDPDYLALAREMTARKLAGGTSPAYEMAVRTGDGRRLWMEVSARLLWDGISPAAVEGIARDITSRKTLEAQLAQAHKMEALGRLAGGIAHDFNNILTVVTGFSDLLLATLGEDDPVRARVDEIRRAGERAAELTRKLLAFGRTRTGQERAADLNLAVQETSGLLHYLIGEQITMTVKHLDQPAWVACGMAELQQVILNLALNARDAMPDGGALTIELSLPEGGAGNADGRVRLTVADTGTGMDADTRAQIFDPFFTTKEAGRGTGLGMSTVYGIVRRSQGAIELDSAPGRGTVVRVEFPLTEAADAGAELAVRPQGQGELIMVVEDQEDVRRYISEALGHAGYRVLLCGGAQEAQEKLNADVRLLLTDIVMPGIAGPALARRCRERFPGLAVVYMSGYPGDKQEIPTDAPFLFKPFTPGQLEGQIRASLDAAGARSAS